MLKEFPKAGDSIVYLGGHEDLTDDLSIGHDYIVERVEHRFDSVRAIILDDVGEEWEIYDTAHDKMKWELKNPDGEKPGVACNLSADVLAGIVGVKAELANGATVTGSPEDVAAVIRNLEYKEFLAEIREEDDLLPGDIAKWDNDLVEVIRHIDGGHAEVKMGVSRFVASIKNLTLVAAAETRLDREES